MQPTPSFLSLPGFCTAGTRTQPAAGTLSTGYTYLQKPPAEEHNFLFGRTIDNTNTASSGLTATMNEINGALTAFGITPSGAVTNQLTQLIYKSTAERGQPIGKIYGMNDYVAPVAWAADGSTMTTYFPSVCLTTINDYADISSTGANAYPDLVPYLRGKKFVYKQGLSGEKSSWSITNWSTSGSLATLTLANNSPDGQEIWLLTALGEDYTAGGGTTGICINLPAPVGNIPAGDYQITAGSINSGSRTFTFSTNATAGSGSGTWSLEVYPHRVAGANGASVTTSARLWNLRGYALHGVSDANAYFAGQLRRRDYMQGHGHQIQTYNATIGGARFSPAGGVNTYTTGAQAPFGTQTGYESDGINGAPRTGKTTHSPSIGVHLYMHAGRFTA